MPVRLLRPAQLQIIHARWLLLAALLTVVVMLSAASSATGANTNGLIAFTAHAGSGQEVFTLDPKTGNSAQLTSSLNSARTLSWSPDGTKLAVALEPAAGTGQIVVLSSAGVELHRFDYPADHAPQRDSAPSWSPDGTKLAALASYVADQIYSFDLATGSVNLVTSDVRPHGAPLWVSDSALLHAYYNLGAPMLEQLDLAGALLGRDPWRYSPLGFLRGVSHAGTELLFESGQPPQIGGGVRLPRETYVTDLSGNNERLLSTFTDTASGDVATLEFAPDDTKLLAWRSEYSPNRQALVTIDAQTGAATELADITATASQRMWASWQPIPKPPVTPSTPTAPASGGTEQPGDPTPSPRPTPDESRTTPNSVARNRKTCTVPTLIGRNASRARWRLLASGCRLGRTYFGPRGNSQAGRASRSTVLRQSKTPGRVLPLSTRVHLRAI